MSATGERNAMPDVGPRFFREAGEVMFQFVIDPGNIIGPRVANKADSEKHPSAWSEFVTDEPQDEPEPAEQPARSFVEPEPEMIKAYNRLEADRTQAPPPQKHRRRRGPR